AADEWDGARADNRGVADVRGEEPRAPRVVGEAVRTDPDGDLLHAWIADGEHSDGVLAAVRGEHQIRFGDERPSDAGQPRNRLDVPPRRDVDHVDRVVRGVSDVDPPRR